jgi:hypothetical protein
MVAEGQEGGGGGGEGGGGREGGPAECEGVLREKRLRAISQVPPAQLRMYEHLFSVKVTKQLTKPVIFLLYL